jgi:carbonic anhydrase/acetyltransferase-like protein (isoleucine patch superfamily)
MIYNFNNISPKIDKDSWFAPNSVLIGDVTLKKNANIWFNATLRGDVEPITIGESSNIQDGSVVHTDPGCPAIVGKNVTVGHLVMLHGCIIGDDCLIGIGCTILNKAKIGRHSIIGANALVTENKVIPERSLVLGSPGKVVRQVTDDEIKHIKENAQHYVDNFKQYKNLGS